MKLIELHILQSFPVSCLNRDDVGAPKTATFGGVTRARISSQCLKRAIRLYAKELCPDLYAGERSRLIVVPIAKSAERYGLPAESAKDASQKLCDELAKIDVDTPSRVKTLMFLSPLERDEIGKELAEVVGKSKDNKLLDKRIKSAAAKIKEAKLKDAADIALFGRMVASDHTLTLEGAAMFSHALSTHRAENDIDFFSAVDELQKEDPTLEDEDRSGSGMMGTLEFTSAVYYRYVGLNLSLLCENNHIGGFSEKDRRRVVDAFLRAAVLAVPEARKNSMNAHTMPGYVLGLVKDQGQPLQLVNAFEKPVASKNGFMEVSVGELKQHRKQLETTWGIKPVAEVSIPEITLDRFCEEIGRHV